MTWMLKGEPLEVQKEALGRMDSRNHYGIFHEMGMGKTATVYADFVRSLRKSEVDIMIVICPNSLKSNWAAEAEKWGVGIDTVVWNGGTVDLNCTPFIFIINYEALIATGGKVVSDLLKLHRVYMAVDESICVKNPGAKRTKKVMKFCEYSTKVRLLSGRPIVQSPLDIWSQLACLKACHSAAEKDNPSIADNPFAFRNRFCVMGGYMGKQIVGVKNVDNLNGIINHYSMQARKEDWTDLPDKIYPTPLSYKMTKIQQGHYDQMEEEFYTVIEEEEVTVQIVMNQMNKLQQITSGFIINEDRKPVNIIDPMKNPKIMLVEQILEEINGKLIIFFNFRQSFENLSRFLGDKEVGFTYLTGGMHDNDIDWQKAKFNDDDNYRVMLAQVSAAKYGHTLLGTKTQPCHTTFFFENSYSLDARIQAEDRNHRHGQKYPVTYLDCEGSDIDRHAVNALQKKLNLSEAILAGKAGRGERPGKK